MNTDHGQDRLTLPQWLARIEKLHPEEIELGLDRLQQVAKRLSIQPTCPVITVAGTNGKGSVCAMLESIAMAAGYRVGTYTSPHFVHFNERFRINGMSVGDDELVAAFEAVDAARGRVELTYFEFSTLAGLHIFQASPLDLLILEVGMGGRLDAVNIVDADCAILTCVDIDHVDFLGADRETIGLEKAHIFRADRPAICADPSPPQSVLAHAEAIGADLWLYGRDYSSTGDRQQWAYRGRKTRRSAMAYPAIRGVNQLLNAAGALAAFEALSGQLPISQQAVRQGFARVNLPGRCEMLAGQPQVVLDVAHNVHAVAHLAANLDNMAFFPQTFAVFGVMANKDIGAMIAAMGDRIDHWLLTDLAGERAATAQSVKTQLIALGQGSGEQQSITTYKSPSEALAQARKMAEQNDRIVVFGSFFTVADILTASDGAQQVKD